MPEHSLKPAQKTNRLYHTTATWNSENPPYTRLFRDLVVCAENKDTAERMTINHIPQEVLNNQVKYDLKIRCRDYGIPQTRHTYYMSQPTPTNRENAEEISPIDHIFVRMAMLWGTELEWRSSVDESDAIISKQLNKMKKIENLEQTLLDWTNEYIVTGTSDDIYTFFNNKLSEFLEATIPETIIGHKITNIFPRNHEANSMSATEIASKQSQETAEELIKEAETKAEKIISDAQNKADKIIRDAQAEASEINAKLADEMSNKIQLFNEQMRSMQSAMGDTQNMVSAVQNMYREIRGINNINQIKQDFISQMMINPATILANAKKETTTPITETTEKTLPTNETKTQIIEPEIKQEPEDDKDEPTTEQQTPDIKPENKDHNSENIDNKSKNSPTKNNEKQTEKSKKEEPIAEQTDDYGIEAEIESQGDLNPEEYVKQMKSKKTNRQKTKKPNESKKAKEIKKIAESQNVSEKQREKALNQSGSKLLQARYNDAPKKVNINRIRISDMLNTLKSLTYKNGTINAYIGYIDVAERNNIPNPETDFYYIKSALESTDKIDGKSGWEIFQERMNIIVVDNETNEKTTT